MPFFGFLASLAAPLLKPIVSSAWEGIKSVGRDLFAQGKERLSEVATTAVKSIGQTISDKANTIGQLGKREIPVADIPQQSDDLTNRLQKLQTQDILNTNPSVGQFQIANSLPLEIQSQLYKNNQPFMANSNNFKDQYQNVPSYNFRSKIAQRRMMQSNVKQNHDFFPNAQHFQKQSNLSNDPGFKVTLQQQEQMGMNKLLQQQPYERGDLDTNFRDEDEEEGDEYGDILLKKPRYN